ncbi:MAG: hypothetical protein ACYS3N_19585 [Planctomycetota bacterium]
MVSITDGRLLRGGVREASMRNLVRTLATPFSTAFGGLVLAQAKRCLMLQLERVGLRDWLLDENRKSQEWTSARN